MSNATTPNVTQDRFFAQIPKAVVYHPDLTGNDVRVYATLSERAGSRRSAWPGMRRIAADIGLSTTTVHQSIEKLESLKFIEVDRTGKTNRYHLPVPESDTVTVPESDTLFSGSYQKLTHTVSKSDTELDQGTRDTSSNEDASSELFEAFFEFWMGKPYDSGSKLSASTRGRLNKAVKEALVVGATADDVRRRGEKYRQTWPGMEPSPQGLMANWERFADDRPEAVSTEGRVDPSPDRNDPTTCRHRATDGGGWCAGCSSQVAYRDDDGMLRWLPGRSPPDVDTPRVQHIDIELGGEP